MRLLILKTLNRFTHEGTSNEQQCSNKRRLWSLRFGKGTCFRSSQNTSVGFTHIPCLTTVVYSLRYEMKDKGKKYCYNHWLFITLASNILFFLLSHAILHVHCEEKMDIMPLMAFLQFLLHACWLYILYKKASLTFFFNGRGGSLLSCSWLVRPNTRHNQSY